MELEREDEEERAINLPCAVTGTGTGHGSWPFHPGCPVGGGNPNTWLTMCCCLPGA